jgi:hypothetical protein
MNTASTEVAYYIVNRLTQAVVARCKTKSGAIRSRDKKDCQYGSYVHIIREVQA